MKSSDPKTLQKLKSVEEKGTIKDQSFQKVLTLLYFLLFCAVTVALFWSLFGNVDTWPEGVEDHLKWIQVTLSGFFGYLLRALAAQDGYWFQRTAPRIQPDK